MPLLDMVGVDSCQRSFCIAFAFLSGESEEDYSWALEHLRSLYQRELPSVILTDRCMAAMNAAALWFSSSKALLCLWHVNKAVLQYCRPLFAPKAAQSTDQAEEQTVTDQRAATGPAKADLMQEDQAPWDGAWSVILGTGHHVTNQERRITRSAVIQALHDPRSTGSPGATRSP